MSKRKQLIIDKEFQLKTTFSIIGMVAGIVAVIVIVIGANIVYNNRSMESNNTNINGNNESMKNINEIQDNFIVGLFAAGDKTLGLVQQKINQVFIPGHGNAFNLNPVRSRVHLGSQLGHRLPVDLDPAFKDQLFPLTSGADAGLGKKFLKSDQGHSHHIYDR